MLARNPYLKAFKEAYSDAGRKSEYMAARQAENRARDEANRIAKALRAARSKARSGDKAAVAELARLEAAADKALATLNKAVLATKLALERWKSPKDTPRPDLQGPR